MFAGMGLAVLVVFLGMNMDHNIITLILIAVTAVLTLICYVRAMVLAEKQGLN
jgi:ABC-2 type transport system permease protein